MKIFFTSLFFITACSISNSQELFPHAEPASNMPKGVIGLRFMGEYFWEIKQPRNMDALRIMYGITPRLTGMITASISNHHNRTLPSNLVTHTHNGNQTIFYTAPTVYGIKYDYTFGGFNFYAKYRFLSFDGDGRHLRMALFGEYSTIKTAHDEAEPDLMEDNGGYGAGLITTWLHNKLAVSLTTGFIIPKKYSENTSSSGSVFTVKTDLIYGRAINYSLSIGYLLFPKIYNNYSETNYTIYTELMGKYYESAQLFQNDVRVDITNPALKENFYLEAHPGIQKIITSNTRIDFSIGIPLINKSYVHFSPLYNIGIQRYFYINNARKEKSKV